MTTPAIEQQVRLIQREAAVRQAARIVELDPTRSREAAGMFRRASEMRAERLELARRCGPA